MTYDDQFESAVFITEWPERKCSKHESGHQYRLYTTNLSRSCATGHIPLKNSNNILYANGAVFIQALKCVESTSLSRNSLAGCSQFHVRRQTKVVVNISARVRLLV